MEDRVSSHSSCSTCTKCQKVCMRSRWCCRGAAGDDSLWWCHCFFCFVLFLTALRGERDPSYEMHTFLRPHGNPWNFLFSCLPLSLTDAFALFSFLPLLSLLARVNLHHVFFNRDWGGDRALVEACEPDTTVNLHFHGVTLSRPSSSSFSPFLCHSFFYWHVTHWTSWKLNWAKLSTSGEACQIPP